MKKFIVATFLIAIAILVFVSRGYCAEDWSQYESGRDNIRLDGYHGQPGYIAFTDGDGTIEGYLFASGNKLLWVSPNAFSTAFGSSQVTEASYANRLSTVAVNYPY
jgi:hypothetical protein